MYHWIILYNDIIMMILIINKPTFVIFIGKSQRREVRKVRENRSLELSLTNLFSIYSIDDNSEL